MRPALFRPRLGGQQDPTGEYLFGGHSALYGGCDCPGCRLHRHYHMGGCAYGGCGIAGTAYGGNHYAGMAYGGAYPPGACALRSPAMVGGNGTKAGTAKAPIRRRLSQRSKRARQAGTTTTTRARRARPVKRR